MLYSFWCSECEEEYTELLPMARRNDPIPCPECGTIGNRLAGGIRSIKTDINSDKWAKQRMIKMAQERKKET